MKHTQNQIFSRGYIVAAFVFLSLIGSLGAQTQPQIGCSDSGRSKLGLWFNGCDNSIPDSFLTPTAIPKPFDIKFVGNANIQKTFESGEGVPANTGIGFTVTKYFLGRTSKTFGGFYRIDVEGSINVASTTDTLKADGIITANNQRIVTNQRDFGTGVLTPLNSGQAVNLQIIGYNRITYFGLISGFSARYTGSNRNWQLNPDTVVQTTSNLIRVGVFHDIVPYKYRNDYSVTLGIAFARNNISGDIGQNENESLRRIFLGTDRKSFNGYEFSLGFRLKNIRAEFNYLIFPSDVSVPGLTGGRLVTTIGFVGGFPIDVD